jgi:hypothetical protein
MCRATWAGCGPDIDRAQLSARERDLVTPVFYIPEEPPEPEEPAKPAESDS